MQKNREVLSETRSLASSEASQGKASLEANCTLVNKVNSSTSLQIRATSFEANMACDEVSQVTCKTSVVVQDQHNGRDQSRRQLSLEAQQTRVNHVLSWKTSTSSDQDASLMVHFDTEQTQFARVHNNSYEPSELLIVDEDVELVVSK